MNELSDKGISFKVREREIKTYGCLLAFLCDSLAAHNTAGFKESFSPTVRYACRRCNALTSDFPKICLHSDCRLRSDSEIQDKVELLKKAKNLAEQKEISAASGIKEPSVLHLVTGFSLTEDALFDPMHIF